MVDPKKIANNILDFLIDPTRIPVQQRVYFRPEEKLMNETYEHAKADALVAYKEQKFNSDLYPTRNRQITKREATLMDRKSLIASFDILSRNFNENDPIGTDLRTMAAAVSKMSENEFTARLASDAPSFEGMEIEAKAKTFPCPKCKTNVLEQTKYCVVCKKKVKPKTAAEEQEPEESAEPKDEVKKDDTVEASVNDFWSKEAQNRVAKALVSDVLGMDQGDDEEAEEAKEPAKVEPKKEEEVEAKKAPKEEEVEAKKDPIVPEEKVEEKVEEKAAAKEPVEEPEAKEPVEEEKKSTVDTDILASITFGDVQLDVPMGIVSSEELGEMTADEQTKLAGLFN